MAAKREVKCNGCEKVWESTAKPENLKCKECDSDDIEDNYVDPDAPEIDDDFEDDEQTEEELLGIARSKVKFSNFKHKDDSAKTDKEERKHKKLADKRVENRIAKAKKLAKMKPIEKRLALLIGRLRAVKARDRGTTYSDAVVKAFTEEYELIKNSPKSWIKATAHGTIPYNPGNKRKITAKERLDRMDLDD